MMFLPKFLTILLSLCIQRISATGTLPGGYEVGQIVYSLVNGDSSESGKLHIGMRGIVYGRNKNQIHVTFDSPLGVLPPGWESQLVSGRRLYWETSNPSVTSWVRPGPPGPTYLSVFPNQISRTRLKEEEIILPGGFKIGQTVYSITNYWYTKDVGQGEHKVKKHVVGMRGTVQGPSDIGDEHQLSVMFESSGESWSVFPQTISKEELASEDIILPGGYKIGNTVYNLYRKYFKSEITLGLGIRGTVQGPASDCDIYVHFEGTDGTVSKRPSNVSPVKVEDIILPGGYKLWDVVYCTHGRQGRRGKEQVKVGMRGVVRGPGAEGNQVIVRWDELESDWGMQPTSITLPVNPVFRYNQRGDVMQRPLQVPLPPPIPRPVPKLEAPQRAATKPEPLPSAPARSRSQSNDDDMRELPVEIKQEPETESGFRAFDPTAQNPALSDVTAPHAAEVQAGGARRATQESTQPQSNSAPPRPPAPKPKPNRRHRSEDPPPLCSATLKASGTPCLYKARFLCGRARDPYCGLHAPSGVERVAIKRERRPRSRSPVRQGNARTSRRRPSRGSSETESDAVPPPTSRQRRKPKPKPKRRTSPTRTLAWYAARDAYCPRASLLPAAARPQGFNFTYRKSSSDDNDGGDDQRGDPDWHLGMEGD